MTMNCRIPYHAPFRITIFGVEPLWACAIFSDNKKESKRCEPLFWDGVGMWKSVPYLTKSLMFKSDAEIKGKLP